MAEIILRAKIALGLHHLEFTDEMLESKVSAFLETIDSTLPPNRLEDVYIRAMKIKQNNYDLSVVDLNLAWQAIKQEEFKPSIYKCHGCIAVDEGKLEGCKFHPMYKPNQKV